VLFFGGSDGFGMFRTFALSSWDSAEHLLVLVVTPWHCRAVGVSSDADRTAKLWSQDAPRLGTRIAYGLHTGLQNTWLVQDSQ